jgi:predicted NBD/HSP70 family sugar kinase
VIPYSTGSKALIRQLNRSAVLNLIKEEGPIARVMIARHLGLSAASVTSIVGELQSLGLIHEVAQAPSAGGRPAELLALNPTAASVIGVKLADDHLAGVVVDLNGAVNRSAELPIAAHDAGGVVDEIARLVEILPGRSNGPRLLGVGVGLPGVIDGEAGICVDSPILGWRDVPLAEMLSTRLGLPVSIDNDVNTLAVAERLYGAGRTVTSFLAVTIGRGIGLGVVVDGHLYRGRLGGAGEFGHLPVEPGGPRCECGRSGCLEALVGDRALVRAAIDAGIIGAEDGPDALTAAADGGDPTARAILADAGTRIGVALSGLVNVLSPQLVILSGEGMRNQDHLEPPLRAALHAHVFPPLTGFDLLIDPWEDTKWARGAAALVLQAFFSAGRESTNGRAVDLAGFVAEAV